MCQILRLRGDCSNNISGCSKTHYQNTNNLPVPANTAGMTLITSTGTTQTTTTATTSGYMSKWVRNLLGTLLTEAQVSLLAHGPNFVVAPRQPPYGEYITVVEQACLKLEPHSAEELRAEMRGSLRHSQNPKRNMTKEEV